MPLNLHPPRRIFHRRAHPPARRASWVLALLCLFLLGAGGGALLAREGEAPRHPPASSLHR